MTQWIKVARLSDLEEGIPFFYDFPYETAALFKVGDRLYCIEDRCSHDDGPLAEGDLDPQACEIVCPRHGARFDLRTGAALSMPAVYPVRQYAIRLDGDDIYLAAPEED